MNLRSWGLDFDLDSLSQQFQENLQKAQEMMNQYSLDQLQEEGQESGADVQKNRVLPPEMQHNELPRGYAESKEMEEATPPSSSRVIATSAPSTIEVTRLPPAPVPLGTALGVATATGSAMVQQPPVRKRSESKPAASAAPKGFFSDDSDVDLENDPILNRSRQRQVQGQTKSDSPQPQPMMPQQPVRQPSADVENQLPRADPDDDKKQRAPQTFISAFDKLSSSSSLSLDTVRRKLGFGAGSAPASTSALSRSQQMIQEVQAKCTTGRKFHVTMLVLGVVMLCYFWKFTVLQG